MDVVELVARVLFAIGFFLSPSGVLKSAPRIAGLPAMKRFPTPVAVALIRITCLMSMVGAVLVALGLWLDVGALLIVGFLVPVTLTMHRFWEMEPGLPRKQRRDAFLSNASLAGGALFIFAAVNQSQHVALAVLSHPLFGRA